MALVFEGIQKVYPNGFRAVNHLDLEVKDGEFFTLLGPSGCGKTTTLRMIAGLETPSAGKVFIGGRDFTRTHPRDRDVAMVFQSYALYPHMTVRENLVLNLKVRKVAADEIERRLQEVSRMLGIERLLDSKPAQLSGGQRQRIALGRALIRRPNIFLMDEPLSNLDLKLRERTRTELKALHERLRVTTVYVTHDQAEALVLSDRIGIMNGGELLQVGTPQEIYDRPSSVFVAKFVGTPSINLVPVSGTARGFHPGARAARRRLGSGRHCAGRRGRRGDTSGPAWRPGGAGRAPRSRYAVVRGHGRRDPGHRRAHRADGIGEPRGPALRRAGRGDRRRRTVRRGHALE